MWTDVHAGANGSSRVVLADGATEVLAVIKAELGQPSYDRPEQGRLEVNVEVSPVAFHGRGPSNFALEDLNAELSQVRCFGYEDTLLGAVETSILSSLV